MALHRLPLLCMLMVVTTLSPQLAYAIDITDLVFGQDTNYLPAAFGDFNSDKLTDLFVITEDEKTLKVLISHTQPPLLRHNDDSALVCTYDSLKIKSLVPGDFDGDGFMDLLLVSLNLKITHLYQVFVLWGNPEKMSLECGNENSPLLNITGQPLVMDVNGDMIPDLFGEQNGTRMFWKFGTERMSPIAIPVSTKNETLPSLMKPSSHAFIDLNNDLAADLWVTTVEAFEMWTVMSNGWNKILSVPRPKGATVVGQTTFADVNMTGQIDVLVPAYKEDSQQSVVYLYNFHLTEWIELEVNFVESSENTWTYPASQGKQYRYTDTNTLRVGDFNLDGYPDLLVTLMDLSHRVRVILLENVECVADEAHNCSYPRKFVPNFDLFKDYGDSVLGTFCDVQEDGTLDVLLVTREENGTYNMAVYKDASEYDAVFVKVLVLTGLCSDDCPLDSIPYGTNQPGPSISYSIITATGGTQVSRATQLAQSAHYALQLPYTIFGLGRNWNFVEVMKVGLPKLNESGTIAHSDNQGVLSRTFTQIVPNSQLVVIPYPMTEPSRWVSKLFITPSKVMMMTAGALVGTCLFVAAIIAILHRREHLQDKREKQQEAHKFHFDAM